MLNGSSTAGDQILAKALQRIGATRSSLGFRKLREAISSSSRRLIICFLPPQFDSADAALLVRLLTN